MKTSIIFVIGFAVLAGAVARVIIPVAFQQALLRAARWSLQNDPEYRKALNARPQPSIPAIIPSPDSLTLKSDPMRIGGNLVMLNRITQAEYVQQLEDLIYENEGKIQGHFYEAALKAMRFPKKASDEWNEHVQKAKNYGKEMVENFPGIDNLFNDDTPLATINDILRTKPLDRAYESCVPIMLYIEKDSSGSFEVASSFNALRFVSGKAKGSIQRLILDRIAEKGGVEEFHRKYFNSPPPKPPKGGQR